MKKILLLPVLAVLCLQACKKDEPKDNEPEPEVVAKPADYFFPMKVGNYWVYEKLNTQNNSITVDTIRIIGDTTIDGNNYYVFNALFPAVLMGGYSKSFVRDSAGYLLNLPFFNDGTKDTLGREDYGVVNTVIKNGVADTVINVPLGNFNCLETVTDVYYVPASGSPTGNNPRYMYEYWSKNVGLVRRSYFYASAPYENIVTLKSFHLQP